MLPFRTLLSSITGDVYARLEAAAIAAAKANGASLWYIRRDLSNVFSDSAGTAAGALNGPVGLVLDRQYGDANFGSDLQPALSAWNPYVGSVAVVGNELQISTTGTNGGVNWPLPTTPGKTYRLSVQLKNGTSSATNMKVGTVAANSVSSTYQTFNYVFVASSSSQYINFELGSAGTGFAKVLSITELLGSHASQSTASAKPTIVTGPAGWPTMQFNGSSGYLATGLQQPGVFTMGFAARRTTNTTMGGSGNSDLTRGAWTANSTSSEGLHSAASAINVASSTSNDLGNSHVVSYSSQVGSQAIYRDGAQIANGSSSTALPTDATALFAIGRVGSGYSGGYCTGLQALAYIAPVVLPIADRRAIERFGAFLIGAPFA